MSWNKLADKRPLATEVGEWDGKRSDEVIVIDKNNRKYIARMYEGFMDGSEFVNFYNSNDFEIVDVIKWCEIPSEY